ncbi:MAG: PspC domain-containing protein [Bacteroidales bacterium]|nr:PspC domain-containing protein [Bacteroidales bacterium]
MEKRSGLYRSKHDSMIGGVASGIGQSINMDPTLIRILFILLVMVGGGGVILYIILWVVLPLDDQLSTNVNTNNMEENKTQEGGKGPDFTQQNPIFKKKDDGSLIAGLILITLGVIFLVIRYVPRINFGDLWPVILIVIGIVLLRNAFVGKK